MKVKCVAMLPNFFLRTNEVSLQIDGCQHQFLPSQINSDIDKVNLLIAARGKPTESDLMYCLHSSSPSSLKLNISTHTEVMDISVL